jgi:hypothetical protein
VGVYVVAGNTARLEGTLWGTGEWANGSDWGGPGTIITGTQNYWGDPAFVNPGGGDYHIRTESAALDAGVFAGVTDDLDGDARPLNPARPDAPDLGADENVALTVRRPVTDTMTFGAACARVTFTGTNSLDYVTVTVVYTYPAGQSSDSLLPRYYVITPAGTGSYTASLALCYTQQEFTQSDVTDEGSLRLYRLASGWEAYSSTVDVDNDVVTATQVTGFSRWTLGGPGPTAVTLASFTAGWDGDEVLVAWETALEIDTVGFNLWRSTALDGEYERVNAALIPAVSLGGVRGGSYIYADADVTPGTTYYYRLEEIEIDGARNWYGPISTGAEAPTAVTSFAARAVAWDSPTFVLVAVAAVVGAGLVVLHPWRRRH